MANKVPEYIFPTSLTEAERFFVQFDIFRLEPVLGQSGGNIVEQFTDAVKDIEKTIGAVANAFEYSDKADELLTCISLPVQEPLSEGSSLEYSEESTRDAARGAAVLAGEKGFMGVLGEVLKEQMPEVAQKMESRFQGKAKNQMQQTFFVSPSKREYTFNFELVARNFNDSNKLEKIINRFQYHSNPGLSDDGGSYWTYPEMVRFFFQERNIKDNKFVKTKVFSSSYTSTESQSEYYESKGCFITGFTVEYGQDGYMKFADPDSGKSGLATAKLTLNLKEAEYFTKEDFAQTGASGEGQVPYVHGMQA